MQVDDLSHVGAPEDVVASMNPLNETAGVHYPDKFVEAERCIDLCPQPLKESVDLGHGALLSCAALFDWGGRVPGGHPLGPGAIAL